MSTKKLHVAMVTTHPPGTGSLNEYAFHFVRFLRLKPEVEKLTLLVDDLPSGEDYATLTDPTNEGAQVDVVPCWAFNDLKNASRITTAVRKAKPDVVLFNIQFASFGDQKVAATLGLLTPAMLRPLGFPTVVLLHNIMEMVDLRNAGFAGGWLMEQLIRTAGTITTWLLLRANLVALTIPKYLEILQAKYKSKNLVLAPHGSFDETVRLPNFDLPNGPMQIMTFGKFGTYKRVEVLLDAFKLLKGNGHPNTELVIAGGNSPNAQGYLEEMKATYSEVNDVRFTGYVPEEDVPKIFGEAAVVVFPYTSTTGSSGVLHQAGDYGKAAVLPHIGDFVEVIAEEGYAGEIFEPNNPRSLAKAIANILDDPNKRRELGTQNFLASRGLPIDEVVDWYLFHIATLID